MKQDKEFIDNYIQSFIQDCFSAYDVESDYNFDGNYENNFNEESLSCIAGIIERFYLSVGTTLNTLCVGKEDECHKGTKYKELSTFFSVIDINDLIQKWTENFSTQENEESNLQWCKELKEMKPEERKNHFITFIESEYEDINGILTEENKKDIRKKADEFSYVFQHEELLLMGGRHNKKNTEEKYQDIIKKH